ncbi:MAG TPA: alpha/beta hydrolase [Smithella sp.]|nr:alpha/beta hydrolase [Smithella sp.]MDM7988531.1 alpha/beta hydrolase [Smithella sp.]HNY48932.1 alpha/beta hydrolase [Smithella sp.]HOG89016.1 alpha/beta hydrolase [Smithella sp.]HOU49732.1 alpha/beta hydrolase [Smithella sp.]
MPFFTRDNAKIYYEDDGWGEAIIAVHGLIENTTYWKDIAADITNKYRFIPMDMRGHGKTEVEGDLYGYDAETIGDDIEALADYLNIKKFHLLTHSTGGFAGVRYAMRNSGRLASLVLTDTASSTAVLPGDPEFIKSYHDKLARYFEKFEWDQIVANLWVNPAPFFRGIVESSDAKKMMKSAYDMISMGNRYAIARFVRSFYTDPDPKIEGLRGIRCPTLIIYGEKDDLFIETSKLMAKEIPDARLIEYAGVGHMTALEVPERLARDVIDFLSHHKI